MKTPRPMQHPHTYIHTPTPTPLLKELQPHLIGTGRCRSSGAAAAGGGVGLKDSKPGEVKVVVGVVSTRSDFGSGGCVASLSSV
ncbi:hypothetical protein E2C01_062893 [Portunus trituberculatus]|uniref:Uncharacterized protein n=1 Tax=Portunus trituberculatus TaxID=210409 RepID=A0A5B7HG50_PORTR|nr:hypothetical protein [Portunus trituberculatus]